jgi:hypothetical protein
VGQRIEGPELLHERVLLRRPDVPGPRGLEERQAQKPVAVLCGEGERRCAAARVADEVKTIEAAISCLSENPGNLRVQAVVRRWAVVRVDLEVLRDRVDPVPQHRE